MGSFYKAKINYQFLTIAKGLAHRCLALQFLNNIQEWYFYGFQPPFFSKTWSGGKKCLRKHLKSFNLHKKKSKFVRLCNSNLSFDSEFRKPQWHVKLFGRMLCLFDSVLDELATVLKCQFLTHVQTYSLSALVIKCCQYLTLQMRPDSVLKELP